jgi:competence CoiA-like predicted nuclease
MNQPKIYEVEPRINNEYIPDVYTISSAGPVLIELQRTPISLKRMQQKVDAFADAFLRKQHDAQVLWIIADTHYKVKAPSGLNVVQMKQDAVS